MNTIRATAELRNRKEKKREATIDSSKADVSARGLFLGLGDSLAGSGTSKREHVTVWIEWSIRLKILPECSFL